MHWCVLKPQAVLHLLHVAPVEWGLPGGHKPSQLTFWEWPHGVMGAIECVREERRILPLQKQCNSWTSQHGVFGRLALKPSWTVTTHRPKKHKQYWGFLGWDHGADWCIKAEINQIGSKQDFNFLTMDLSTTSLHRLCCPCTKVSRALAKTAECGCHSCIFECYDVSIS